jgi:hypothetical protein
MKLLKCVIINILFLRDYTTLSLWNSNIFPVFSMRFINISACFTVFYSTVYGYDITFYILPSTVKLDNVGNNLSEEKVIVLA